MNKTAILIPTGFGDKSLTNIGGIPLIARIIQQCKASGFDTYVLTDDKRIADETTNWTHTFFHPGSKASNGTELCAESIKHELFNEYDNFINVQIDMPDITPEMIHTISNLLNIYSVATLYTDMDPELQTDPNTVKVVTYGMNAQWFGRGITYGHQHLGIYGYKHQSLVKYLETEQPPAEQIDGMEQHRWFAAGIEIGVHKVK